MLKEGINYIIILFLLMSTLVITEAKNDILIVPLQNDKINISKKGTYIRDGTRALDIHQVIKSQPVFKPITDSLILNKTRLNADYWLKYQLYNPSDKDIYYSLKIRDPFIHHLQLYRVVNQNLSNDIDESGIYIPYSKRKIDFREHISSIEIPAQSEVDLYLKIDKHTKSLRINIELWDTTKLLHDATRFDLIIGILYGIFFIYSFIVILLYFQFKKKFLLGYLLYLIGGILYNLSNSGMLYQYILGNFPGSFNAIIRPYSLFFTAMGLLYFSHHLFNNPIRNKFLNLLRRIYNNFYSFLFVFGSIAYFTLPVKFHITYLSIFSLLGQIICFSGILLSAIIVFDYYKKFKTKDALAFIIAYVILFGFGIIYIIQSHFKIIYSSRFFSENNGITLLSIEAIIMSIAISIRINEIIKSRDLLKLEVEKQKLELANSLMKGEENERKRVSKELHDSIGSSLSAIGLFLDQLNTENNLKDKIRSMVTHTTKEVRRISQDLMPYQLSKNGLIKSIENHIEEISLSSSIRIQFIPKFDEDHLSNFQKINILRIIQELINNSVKHANPEFIIIHIHQENDLLRVLVEDDGVGFEPGNIIHDNGKAFHSLQYRSENLKAKYDIITAPNEGTTITLEFPFIPYS